MVWRKEFSLFLFYFSSYKDTYAHQYRSAHCFSCVRHERWRGNSASTRLIFRMLLMLSNQMHKAFLLDHFHVTLEMWNLRQACTRVRSKCRQVKLNGATAGRWCSTAVVATSHLEIICESNCVCIHCSVIYHIINSVWLSVKVLLHWNLYNKAINPWPC